MKKKVLLIEDSRLFAAMLREKLEEKQLEVLVSSSGEEGLLQAQASLPDLVILDLILPKMPGEAVCRTIKADPALSHIPVIMLTAKDSDADRVIGRVIGADHYLVKPFAMNEFLAAVDRLLKI